jgi:hypothetical protein
LIDKNSDKQKKGYIFMKLLSIPYSDDLLITAGKSKEAFEIVKRLNIMQKVLCQNPN